MATATEAKEWAREHLRGNCSSRPYFECSGKPGVYEYLRYVTERTDMPLGFFNSHSTGLVLTPQECVDLYREIPALCGLKMRATIRNYTYHLARPGTFTRWGAGFKFGASLLGLPVGDYPHSRPPQTAFPDELKEPIRAAYRASGFLHADR